jgi:hypothetical protein
MDMTDDTLEYSAPDGEMHDQIFDFEDYIIPAHFLSFLVRVSTQQAMR